MRLGIVEAEPLRARAVFKIPNGSELNELLNTNAGMGKL